MESNEFFCVGCGEPKDKAGFYISLNPEHKKYLPLCRQCIAERMKSYTEKTGSMEAAFYTLCAELNYPIIKEHYDIAKTLYAEKERTGNIRGSNLFTIYHTVLKDFGLVVEGFWQTDVDFSDVYNYKRKRKLQKELNAYDLSKLEQIWGKFELTDYQLLEQYYQMYTQEIDPERMSVSLSLRYRDLCKAELRKRKADESGNMSDIKSAQDVLNKQLAMLDLNDFKDKATDERLKFIDRVIWEIEETEPAEDEDEKTYRDIAGYEKIYNSFMRSMKNILMHERDYPAIPEEEK